MRGGEQDRHDDQQCHRLADPIRARLLVRRRVSVLILSSSSCQTLLTLPSQTLSSNSQTRVRRLAARKRPPDVRSGREPVPRLLQLALSGQLRPLLLHADQRQEVTVTTISIRSLPLCLSPTAPSSRTLPMLHKSSDPSNAPPKTRSACSRPPASTTSFLPVSDHVVRSRSEKCVCVCVCRSAELSV